MPPHNGMTYRPVSSARESENLQLQNQTFFLPQRQTNVQMRVLVKNERGNRRTQMEKKSPP